MKDYDDAQTLEKKRLGVSERKGKKSINVFVCAQNGVEEVKKSFISFPATITVYRHIIIVTLIVVGAEMNKFKGHKLLFVQ